MVADAEIASIAKLKSDLESARPGLEEKAKRDPVPEVEPGRYFYADSIINKAKGLIMGLLCIQADGTKKTIDEKTSDVLAKTDALLARLTEQKKDQPHVILDNMIDGIKRTKAALQEADQSRKSGGDVNAEVMQEEYLNVLSIMIIETNSKRGGRLGGGDGASPLERKKK